MHDVHREFTVQFAVFRMLLSCHLLATVVSVVEHQKIFSKRVDSHNLEIVAVTDF